MISQQDFGNEYNETTAPGWGILDPKSAWVVYRLGKIIELVYFRVGRTAEQVRNELVYQSGYAFDIEVKRPS